MSRVLTKVRQAANEGRVMVSDHALLRMLERQVDIQSTVSGVHRAIMVEDYSVSRQEPRVLVAQREPNGRTIHVVWEAPETDEADAVIVTVFHPDR